MVFQLIDSPHLSGKSPVWSEGEKEIVRQYYDSTPASRSLIADNILRKFNIRRTPEAIRRQASCLGLTNSHYTKWSPDEIKLLEDMIGTYNTKQLAARLGRTQKSVIKKCQDLGLSMAIRNDWYTKSEVAHILGVGDKTVQKWINAGKLTACHHNPQNPDHSVWHININALRKFICRYPTELTGRNVDILQLVTILYSDST